MSATVSAASNHQELTSPLKPISPRKTRSFLTETSELNSNWTNAGFTLAERIRVFVCPSMTLKWEPISQGLDVIVVLLSGILKSGCPVACGVQTVPATARIKNGSQRNTAGPDPSVR